jgi:hypothetical protein
MIETSVMLVVLIVVALWYTGWRSSNADAIAEAQSGKKVPLFTPTVYAGLLVFAVVLAILLR